MTILINDYFTKKYSDCGTFIECNYRGTIYTSGAEWSDADDPCASYKCIAGVVTESSIQCYVPCNNPLPPRPGQCCATCLGMFLKEYLVKMKFASRLKNV